jgi:serine/threonine-protein kinase
MASENLAGRTIAGYRLLERVGEGGTAAVYRAQHSERGLAAVKILKDRFRSDPVAMQRFLREAGYGARVQHPCVVRTYDFGQVEGLHYLALEWAEGEPLSAYVSRNGPVDPPLVARVIDQLASALGGAHAVGIIHRDLKPENTMFERGQERVKLLDFGIARDAQQTSNERLTRAGFFVGTPMYVAPEALSGAQAGEPADIYSLAMMTYFLLTARHPFVGKSARDLFTQLLNSDPRPLKDAAGPDLLVTPALQQAVMTGLSRDPSQRQKSVREFADDVIAALGEPTPDLAPQGAIDRILRALGLR